MAYASIDEVYGNGFGQDLADMKYAQVVQQDVQSRNRRPNQRQQGMAEQFSPNSVEQSYQNWNNNPMNPNANTRVNTRHHPQAPGNNTYYDMNDQYNDVDDDDEYEVEESNMTCNDYITHIKSCESCQKALGDAIKKADSFADYLGSEAFQKNLFDLIVYISVGIFIIFVLDLFLRLGKSIK